MRRCIQKDHHAVCHEVQPAGSGTINGCAATGGGDEDLRDLARDRLHPEQTLRDGSVRNLI
jgi:hypothetical protein